MFAATGGAKDYHIVKNTKICGFEAPSDEPKVCVTPKEAKSMVFKGSAVDKPDYIVLTENKNTQKGLATMGPSRFEGLPLTWTYEAKIGTVKGQKNADGIWAFLSTEMPDALGHAGGGGPVDSTAVIGMELDHYRNGNLGDPTADHVAIFYNSKSHDYLGPFGIKDIEDSKWHKYEFKLERASDSTAILATVKVDSVPAIMKKPMPLKTHTAAALDTVGSQVYFSLFGTTGGSKGYHYVRKLQVCGVSKPLPPLDCDISDWTDWDDCSEPCGPGTQTRRRDIIQQPARGGKECPTLIIEDKPCTADPCPAQCTETAFVAEGECSVECGGGMQTWTRTVTCQCSNPADTVCVDGCKEENIEQTCGSRSEERSCGADPCVIDCEVGEWMDWSDCSVKCGKGTRFHSRIVEIHPLHGGQPCPPLNATEDCDMGECACAYGEWTSWGKCDQVCGDLGQAERTREILHDDGKPSCAEGAVEQNQCNRRPCPHGRLGTALSQTEEHVERHSMTTILISAMAVVVVAVAVVLVVVSKRVKAADSDEVAI
eukprot:385204_1